jgi:serine/threonine protein kinase
MDDTSGPTQPIIGDTLLAERYRLLDKVGEGGAAEVFRARDQRLDRVVAIKILRRQFVNEQAARTRFLNEARAAAGLAHPNIVDVYDFGQTPDGSMFIAMQFVEGQNLKDMLQRRGRMTAAESVSIVTQVCAALSAAHARGLIHRDVKPQNILVDRKGHARLGDFGIVKALSGPELTQAGMTFGTAAYLSPEQATGEPVGPASDVYSLGCVMYEMLSGTPPFTGDNPAIVAYKQVWEQPRPLHDLAPEVPPSLESVVMRCLLKDPRARYPNTDTLAADLPGIGSSFNQPTMAVPTAPASHVMPVTPGSYQASGRPPRRTQAEISQQIPMAPQPAGGVPQVRAQTTNSTGTAGVTPVGVPQVTRHVTQPQAGAYPQYRQRTHVTPARRGAGRRSALVWGLMGGLVVIGLGLCTWGAMGNNAFFGIFGGPTPTPTLQSVLPSPTPSPTPPPVEPPSTTPVPPSNTAVPATEVPTEAPTNTPEVLPTDTSVPVPTDTIEPFPTDTPEIVPTDTVEVFPTDTVEPFPSDTPIVMPTVIEPPTPLPTGEEQIVLDDSSFVGGYSRRDGYHGRTAQWVYGQGTEYNTMSARFFIESEKKPKEGNLSVLGVDSEDVPKTRMRVTLNDYVLYEGPNPMPNDTHNGPGGEGNWGWAGWPIPNKVLQEGENVLSITNLDPSNQINYPIFIMIDQVVVSW